VDPVVDEVRQDIKELIEHQPEAREADREEEQARLEQAADAVDGDLERVDVDRVVVLWLAEEEERDEVERDAHGAGDEHILPVEYAQIACEQRPDEAADVDHLVEDAPAERADARWQ